MVVENVFYIYEEYYLFVLLCDILICNVDFVWFFVVNVLKMVVFIVVLFFVVVNFVFVCKVNDVVFVFIFIMVYLLYLLNV